MSTVQKASPSKARPVAHSRERRSAWPPGRERPAEPERKGESSRPPSMFFSSSPSLVILPAFEARRKTAGAGGGIPRKRSLPPGTPALVPARLRGKDRIRPGGCQACPPARNDPSPLTDLAEDVLGAGTFGSAREACFVFGGLFPARWNGSRPSLRNLDYSQAETAAAPPPKRKIQNRVYFNTASGTRREGVNLRRPRVEFFTAKPMRLSSCR